MQRFIVAFHNFSVSTTTRSFLDGSTPTNGNLTAGLAFQFLLGFTTWSNDESNKVVVGVFFDWNTNLFDAFANQQGGSARQTTHHSTSAQRTPTRTGRSSFAGESHNTLQQVLTLRCVTFSPTHSSCIFAFSVRAVDCKSATRSKRIKVRRERVSFFFCFFFGEHVSPSVSWIHPQEGENKQNKKLVRGFPSIILTRWWRWRSFTVSAWQGIHTVCFSFNICQSFIHRPQCGLHIPQFLLLLWR
mmetsp:Transcript_33885/g.70434  ORF Transcript_33885/g.70434 Transcript_33885/m.70434 type:complete len:244 (-) Transcript_33885:523-1254(-)